MRYRLIASFQTEARKGFVTCSEMDKEFDDPGELSEAGSMFLSRYDSKHCHHLLYQVKEVGVV